MLLNFTNYGWRGTGYSSLQVRCFFRSIENVIDFFLFRYRVIECKGPTNTRVYTVAVYFRNKRLAKATGHSIQQAEMNAAKKALEMSSDLFPQLDHQKRVIAKSMKRQKYPNHARKSEESDSDSQSPKGGKKSSRSSSPRSSRSKSRRDRKSHSRSTSTSKDRRRKRYDSKSKKRRSRSLSNETYRKSTSRSRKSRSTSSERSQSSSSNNSSGSSTSGSSSSSSSSQDSRGRSLSSQETTSKYIVQKSETSLTPIRNSKNRNKHTSTLIQIVPDKPSSSPNSFKNSYNFGTISPTRSTTPQPSTSGIKTYQESDSDY